MRWLTPPSDFEIVELDGEPLAWSGTTRDGHRVWITDAEHGGIPDICTRATCINVLAPGTTDTILTVYPGSLHAAREWLDNFPEARDCADGIRETLDRLRRGELERAAFIRVVAGQLDRARGRDVLPELLSLLVPEASS